MTVEELIHIELEPQQRRLMQAVYDVFRAQADWPTQQFIDTELDRLFGIDSQTVLATLPPTVALYDHYFAVDSSIRLSVAGIACCEDSSGDQALFLSALLWCVESQRSFHPKSPTETERLRLTSEQAREDLPALQRPISNLELRKIFKLLSGEGLPRSSGYTEDHWEIEIDRDIRRYRHVRDIGDYLKARGVEAAPSLGPTAEELGLSLSIDAAPKPEDGGAPRHAPSVFISYSHEDRLIAEVVASGLTYRGHRVWIDQGELRVGDSLIERISEAVDEADFLVALVSGASLGSRWCQKELAIAMTGELSREHMPKVLPLQVGDVQMPAAVTDKYYLRVDIENPESVVPRLHDDIVSHGRSRGRDDPDQQRSRPPDPRVAVALPKSAAQAESTVVRSNGDLRNAAVSLMREDDKIGLRELLRSERNRFERTGRELVAIAQEEGPESELAIERLRPLEAKLVEVLERKFAGCFPLVQYGDVELIREELRWLAQLLTADWRLGTGSYAAWAHSPRWLAWSLVYGMGAVACATERFEVVRLLWEQHELEGRREPLPAIRLLGAEEFSGGLELARFGKRLALGPFWHLGTILAKSPICSEHYPELSPVLEASLRRLSDFSWLVTALGGRDSVRVIKWWTGVGNYAGDRAEAELPDLMRHDGSLARRIARQALGLGSAAESDVELVYDWVGQAGGTSF